ncbi:GNAT family N-acetyltransferase [uncultured Kordia sp.]|uniref:GNAT family N-acetyltransferase n=1 Tax=uncultured Kordia sp. TaxID=507699 RepID=UPI0026170AE6|nr:GNAT family N-acetyltransferase [uncultured Kordia sp.]
MKNILETERLVLREFIIEDVAFVIQLVNTPTWIEFIGDRNIKTETAAQDYIENSLMKSYATNGFGLWLMKLKETSKPIGMCGLVKRDTLEDVDIGFALLPEYGRKGYTFEAAKATLNYAKDTLNIQKIVAITDTKNAASIGLLNKIGLQFEKELQLSEDDTVLLFS